MVALLDTNVILNFITKRDDPFREASMQIMVYCADGLFSGVMAFHSLSTIWYVIRKQKNEQEARFWLEHLTGILKVEAADKNQIRDAIRNQSFRDFEDCLQDKCAVRANADYLVTCNMRDYIHAQTKVVSPTDFIRLIEAD